MVKIIVLFLRWSLDLRLSLKIFYFFSWLVSLRHKSSKQVDLPHGYLMVVVVPSFNNSGNHYLGVVTSHQLTQTGGTYAHF